MYIFQGNRPYIVLMPFILVWLRIRQHHLQLVSMYNFPGEVIRIFDESKNSYVVNELVG